MEFPISFSPGLSTSQISSICSSDLHMKGNTFNYHYSRGEGCFYSKRKEVKNNLEMFISWEGSK